MDFDYPDFDETFSEKKPTPDRKTAPNNQSPVLAHSATDGIDRSMAKMAINEAAASSSQTRDSRPFVRQAVSYDETNLEKFIRPRVDRSTKPRSTSVGGDMADTSSGMGEGIGAGLGAATLSPEVEQLRKEAAELRLMREKKVAEFRALHSKNEMLIDEQEKRVRRLQSEEKKLDELQVCIKCFLRQFHFQATWHLVMSIDFLI